MTSPQSIPDTTHPSPEQRHVRIVRRPVGWEVREEEGQRLVRSVVVTDWHRVERAVQSFAHAEPAADAR